MQDVKTNNGVIKTLAEIALAIVLFTDASRIQLKLLRQEYNLPLRLLGIGSPLTTAFGTIFPHLLFPNELNIWEAAVF
ncbi:NhaP-type Na+/H+ and K+/H+ antiporter protein [Calothrix parasitica NIES-267]|uniref:NhaP-type Na+/H+ and K+/H+ antiporter protein n=1 Tax=Calothrix parasitica NIES-267 TaxID=1973488 RepID=A0A1Z4LHK0_9CYAN|nr:NhaP-type Na+/H+ and K+/H+ antiporter protein [Calothrix parasitica NIES-267]